MGIKIMDTDTGQVTETPTEAASLLACLMCMVRRAGGRVEITKEEIDATNGTLVQNNALEFEGVELNFVEASSGPPS